MSNNNERDKMTNTKEWLVIEKTNYGENNCSFTVAKNHKELEQAMTYKVYLEKLNDRKNRTYFLASDVDTVMNTVVSAHSKYVANGTYYEKENKKVESEETDEIRF